MRCVPTLLVCLTLLAGAPARADDTTVVVVPVIVGQSLSDAEIHAAVQAAARYRAGLRVLSSAEARAAGAHPDELAACGVDPVCLGRKMASARASLALIVLANFMTEQPLVALRLFDARAESVVASSAAPLALEERGLRNAITTRAQAVFDQAAFAPRGRVRVDVTPADAVVRVDGGEPDPTDPRAFLVPVGPTTVRAEASGYGPAEVAVVAASSADVSVQVVLSGEGGSSVLSSPWFWTAAVGAVLVTGALVYVGVEASRCVCVTREGQTCSC